MREVSRDPAGTTSAACACRSGWGRKSAAVTRLCGAFFSPSATRCSLRSSATTSWAPTTSCRTSVERTRQKHRCWVSIPLYHDPLRCAMQFPFARGPGRKPGASLHKLLRHTISLSTLSPILFCFVLWLAVIQRVYSTTNITITSVTRAGRMHCPNTACGGGPFMLPKQEDAGWPRGACPHCSKAVCAQCNVGC